MHPLAPPGISTRLNPAAACGRKDMDSVPQAAAELQSAPRRTDGSEPVAVSTQRLLTGGSTAGQRLVKGPRPSRIKALEVGELGFPAAAKPSNVPDEMFAPSRTKTWQTCMSVKFFFLFFFCNAHPYKVFSITQVTQIKKSKQGLLISASVWVFCFFSPSLFKGCVSSHYSAEPFNALNTHQEALSRRATSNNCAHIAAL